jgi:hypothetical protein
MRMIRMRGKNHLAEGLSLGELSSLLMVGRALNRLFDVHLFKR